MKRHIVLVGLPGCGKTTVGRLVAERLGAQFVDIDATIVRKMQMPITRIFGEYGESRFRELEADAMRQVLGGQPAVIAPGGGWAAQPGSLEDARDRCFLIYLRTMALTAARRAAEEERPLLSGKDPVERMRELLKEREPFYLQSDTEVKADTKPAAALADEIVVLARQQAGWG